MTVTVTHYTTLEGGEKPYVVYHILCVADVSRWEVLRRYSEFEKLDKILSHKKHRSHAGKLPSKILFGNMSATQLQKRMQGLQIYLDTILSEEGSFEDEDISNFLEIKKHVKPSARRSIISHVNSDNIQALYDFESRDETELHFKKGDQIIVLQRESEWWYGHMKYDKSRYGFFPASCVQPLVTTNQESPKPLSSLSNMTYNEGKGIKGRPVGSELCMAFDYFIEDQDIVLHALDRVSITTPEKNESARSGFSYILHRKRQVCTWLPDEYLVYITVIQ